MRFLLLFLMIFFPILAISPARAALDSQLPPRLLVAIKHNKFFFLLPETHIGLQSQYDAYFTKIILPAFNASSELLAERIEEVQLDQKLRYEKCANEDPLENQIDPIINDLLPSILPKTIWARVPAPGPVEGFGRFMRTELLIDDIYFNRYKDPNIAMPKIKREQIPPTLTLGYANRLMREMPRRFVSVDTPDSLFRAYCSMTPNERNAMVNSLLDLRKSRAVFFDRPLFSIISTGISKWNNEYRLLLNETLLAINGTRPPGNAAVKSEAETAAMRFILAARNRGWIENLESFISNEHLPFFIIGAAHFPDTAAGLGIIHLLQNEGYQIAPVRDHLQLREILASLPPASENLPSVGSIGLFEEKLPGKCTSTKNLKLCVWSSNRIMVNYTENDSELGLLTVCTTRDTVWGKNSDCTNVKVPSSTISIGEK